MLYKVGAKLAFNAAPCYTLNKAISKTWANKEKMKKWLVMCLRLR